MLCGRTHEWLTQAELPREQESAPAEVSLHLRDCAHCQGVLARLQGAEKAWREQPLPPSSAETRDEFLLRHESSPAVPPRRSSRVAAWSRWLVAASLLIAVGASVYFTNPPRSALVESDVIEQLIQWNVQLSETVTPDDRRDLYAGQVESLKADANRLVSDDRTFADSLIRNGEWLATHAEPLEEADRFGILADTVVERMNKAVGRKDSKATAKHAKQFEFISTRAIDPKIERAREAADEARRKKLEKVEAREAKRREKIEKIHTAAPAAAKKAIDKALELTKPKAPKKNAKKPGITG